MKLHKFYCPICEYQIIEEEFTEGDELFCQNCLAWSKLTFDSNNEPIITFLRYDSRETKDATNRN